MFPGSAFTAIRGVRGRGEGGGEGGKRGEEG